MGSWSSPSTRSSSVELGSPRSGVPTTASRLGSRRGVEQHKKSTEPLLNKKPGKTCRGHGQRNKTKTINLKILGTNADGISSKKNSFTNLIKEDKPTVFMLQETKLRKQGLFTVQGYQIFESLRKDNGGGGLALGVSNELNSEPILITKSEDLLIVEMMVREKPIRLFTGYGPQENTTDEKAQEFYSKPVSYTHLTLPTKA